MQDFEKLGVFYLGKRRDIQQGQTTDDLILYDSRDLTTHAMVVGMTGSGKTGLCVTLLEEAALDRIPAIVIDPKGDVSNLMLTFPELRGEDFRPWIDEGEAARRGLTADQFAAAEAEQWKQGLANWGQDGNRIRALRDAVEIRVFTPGSTAGRPLSILKSFAAPSSEVVSDTDGFRERISAAVSGLLALLGIEADPIRSREHILISKILEQVWGSGSDLDIGRLIKAIQAPPFSRVGVMELDAFFPPADREGLAMTLNNLLASPAFASWMQGDSLDVKRLLHTDQGKPCISILSIAHLSEPQRMFFVTVLLNDVVSWVRTQSGTNSLRAILFMDEILGFFPPTANPPAKPPMMTLLKQSRAYGLGIVLATQNPVDLDYKGLANTGTWFLGRLQTERDKLRVLDGLEGASTQAGSAFDRAATEKILSGLGQRIFLMNNVHEQQPVVFETRWAMSYLCGPLTRAKLQRLTERVGSVREEVAVTAKAEESPPPKISPIALDPSSEGQELIPENVGQSFAPLTRQLGPSERLIYRPALWGLARLYYSKAACNVDIWLPRGFVVELEGESVPDEPWETSRRLEPIPEVAESAAVPSALFAGVPAPLQRSKQYSIWEQQFRDYLYRDQELSIWSAPELKAFSQPGETIGDFRVRLEQLVSERRDADIDKLRKRYAPQFQVLQDRQKRASDKVEREREQYKQRRLDSILHTGSTILGAILGRRKFSATNVSKASTSVRSIGRAASERGDVNRAEDQVEQIDEQLAELQTEFDAALHDMGDKLKVAELSLEEIRIRPRKSDIHVQKFGVLWLPYVVDGAGLAMPAHASSSNSTPR